MPKGRRSSGKATSGANFGFEAKLWLEADKLRGHMDAARYRHTFLGSAKHHLKHVLDRVHEDFPSQQLIEVHGGDRCTSRVWR